LFEEEFAVLGFVGVPEDAVGSEFPEFFGHLEIVLAEDEYAAQFEMAHFDDEFLQHLLDGFGFEVGAEVVDYEHCVAVFCGICLGLGVYFLEDVLGQFVIHVALWTIFFKDVVSIGDGVETDFRNDDDDVVVCFFVKAFQSGYDPGCFARAHPAAENGEIGFGEAAFDGLAGCLEFRVDGVVAGHFDGPEFRCIMFDDMDGHKICIYRYRDYESAHRAQEEDTAV